MSYSWVMPDQEIAQSDDQWKIINLGPLLCLAAQNSRHIEKPSEKTKITTFPTDLQIGIRKKFKISQLVQLASSGNDKPCSQLQNT